MHRLRLPGLLLLAGLALAAPAGMPRPESGFEGQSVAVEPARTSIYVGTVTLTMPTFVRRGAVFESTYDCKVFPYFFANEHGTLRIDVTDADLDALRRGQPIDFRGHARSHRDRGADGGRPGDPGDPDGRTAQGAGPRLAPDRVDLQHPLPLGSPAPAPSP